MNKAFKIFASLILIGASSFTHGVTVNLDFANANFQDGFTRMGPAGEIRWNRIAEIPGETGPSRFIDLVATLSPGSTYTPGGGPSNTNGGTTGSTAPAVPAGATLIKVQVGTDVSFDFNFIQRSTGNPIAVTSSISFLDFDQTNSTGATENLALLGLASTASSSFTYATSNQLNINTTNPLQPVFMSTIEGTQSDNPTDLSNLTVDQQEKIVQLNFNEVTGFTLNLSVGGTPPAADPDAARTFFLSGETIFTVPTTTTQIPEPTTALCLTIAAICILLRKHRH